MEEPQREKEITIEKRRPSSSKVISWIMLVCGGVSIIVSIFYNSSLLAFMGLSLTFWGALLFYLKTEKYAHKLLDTSMLPSLSTLSGLIQELNYKGNPVYLPPKYFENPETTKIYISKQKEAPLPKPEVIQRNENRLFVKNSKGILITPPGAELVKFFERTLEKSFTKLDLNSLDKNLQKLFVEELEIAGDLEFEIKKDSIHLKIINSIYSDPTNLSGTVEKIGGPISSAIACAVTKASGKPIIIENTKASENSDIIEVNLRLLGKAKLPSLLEAVEFEEPGATIQETFKPILTPLFMNRLFLLLTLLGSIILAWVSWLTWFDITIWGKDITLVFFGSRTDEAIGLGIGMKLIYYFLIGLALQLSGLFLFLRRKRSKG